MSKINFGIQRISYFFVMCEFFTIVDCNDTDLFFEW